MIKKQRLVFTALTTSALVFSGCDKSKNSDSSAELNKTKEKLVAAEKSQKASEFRSSELSQEVGRLNAKIKSLEAELADAKKIDPNNQKIEELQTALEDLKKSRSEKLEDLSALSETYFGIRISNESELILELDVAPYYGNEVVANAPSYTVQPDEYYEKMLKNITLTAKLPSNDERNIIINDDSYLHICQTPNEQAGGNCKADYSSSIKAPLMFEITGTNPTSSFHYLKNKPVFISRMGLVKDPASTDELTKINSLDFTKDLTFYFYQANPKKFRTPMCLVWLQNATNRFYYVDLTNEYIPMVYEDSHLKVTLNANKTKKILCDEKDRWQNWNNQAVRLNIQCLEGSTFYRGSGPDVHLYTVEVSHKLFYPIDKTYSASDFNSLCPSS